MEKRTILKRLAEFVPVGLLALLLCASCWLPLENDRYQFTVINPDASIGRVFIDEGDGDREVQGVYSRAYFRDMELRLRAELLPCQRTVFSGWSIGYPTGISEGGRFLQPQAIVVDVGDNAWEARPRFAWEYNNSPRWILADRILFVSNRAGRTGVWSLAPDGSGRTAVAVPGDGDGDVSYGIVSAWRDSHLFLVGCSSQTVLWSTAIGGAIASLDASNYPDFSLSGGGALTVLPSYPSGDGTMALRCYRADGSLLVTKSLSASRIDWGGRGSGRFLYFVTFKTTNEFEYSNALHCLDTATGVFMTYASFSATWNGLKILGVNPLALAPDGAVMALGVPVKELDGSTRLRMYMARSDGSVTDFYASGADADEGGFLSTVRFSSDGQSLCIPLKAGGWGAWDWRTGEGPEIPTEDPSTLGGGWREVENAEKPYAFVPKADGQWPATGASVSAQANGKNTDLFMVDAADPDGRWITGAGF